MSVSETEPCEACDTPIDPTLQACPECGNEPAAAAKKAAIVLTIVGIGLSFTGVGALLGVPMILIGLVVFVALWLELADYSPTSHDF